MKQETVKIRRTGLGLVIIIGAIIALLTFFVFGKSKQSEAVSTTAGSEVPYSENSIENEKEELPIENWEVELIARAVIHETGNNGQYFPGFDINQIQKYMASVIWNRVNNPNFPNTVYDVLIQPGQFMPVEELWSIDLDYTTYQNVLEVVKGDFQSDALFEMSFNSLDIQLNQTIMEEQVGSVYPIYSAITADNRYILFAGSNIY